MDSKFAALANTPEKQFYAKSATVLEALSLDGIQNGWFENQKNRIRLCAHIILPCMTTL